ncbi:DUF3313 domain-containing protein [Dongia soli]|uniref:DUF3313 domain-containing protein n=1 Tax=Dongia soli TaxID=600628 RepID=A0ABU5EEE0_9PROT|nr:DUF3313 domain-containing protein [Dongia soli]MDY0884672.1 DUF3313 domain-containing protein [Dongia soli]
MTTLTSHGIHPRPVLRSLAVIAAICAIAACSRTTQMSDVKPAGGFLPQPVLLQPGKSGEASLVYLNPQMSSGGYDKVILDPVTIWVGQDSRLNDLPADVQQSLADTFNGHIYEALSNECQMTTEPGPNTIRVRVALTDAVQSDPGLNTISTYIPQAHVVSTLAAFAFNDGAGVFAGSASAEGYATDSKTGVLLWQAVDQRAGQNALGTNTFNSWEDVDNAFVAWSKQFAERLRKLGICQKQA